MYQNTQPLDKAQNLQFSQLQTYHFSVRENFCPIFLLELPQVIREYFVCFPNNQTDLPHAILGFQKDTNQYLAKDGSWQADYIPAYIRRYPFILARVEGSQQAKDEFTLAADVDADHFNQLHGQPLFTPEGNPGPVLHSYIELLKGIEQQRIITQQAVREIERAGLFKMEQMTIKLKDQPVASIGGLRMIDEDKLAGCALRPGLAMNLVYAHLHSKAALQYGVLSKRPGSAPKAGVAGIVFEDDMITFQ